VLIVFIVLSLLCDFDFRRSQYVHPKHPPHKEYRDDGARDVNDPVAGCFRFSKIEHAAMVTGTE